MDLTKKILLLFLLLKQSCQIALAQEVSNQAVSRTFDLGEVQVIETRFRDSTASITSAQLEKFSRVDLSNALNLLPGINLANVGPRNESVIYMRGFDLRQVPVFIDGVPVYVPYDGYVDMGRFITFDLAQINISKGFSSILYGPNAMGGAINLVTRKPVEKFEINGSLGLLSGSGRRWHINTGSKLNKFYYQLSASQVKQDTYPLSDAYIKRQYQQIQDRENAYRDDLKLSAKLGFMPNETDEYVIGYVHQQGEKGNPPYVGDDSKISTRFWKWPKWNKQSIYFIGSKALNTQNKIKARLYYDTFVNSLFSYDDTTYTVQNKGYAFQSYYNDYTLGGQAEFESRVIKNNVLRINVQYKRDVHRENDLNEPVQNYIDNTYSAAIENSYQITPQFLLVPGISYHVRSNEKALQFDASSPDLLGFDPSKNAALNAQLGLFWHINTRHALHASIGRKTRFATIKDRYSYRMGTAIPNPDLKAEVAINYDVSYTGTISSKTKWTGSVFRSNIDDIIQQVDNVQPNKFQLQNAGKALFYGAELGINSNLIKNMTTGSNYTFIKRKNKINPEILFTHVPEHKVFTYAEYSWQRLNVRVSHEYNSDRFSSSYGTIAKSYSLFNTKTSVKICNYMSVEAGMNNIFDKNYTLVEGFPEAGRNYFINLLIRNF